MRQRLCRLLLLPLLLPLLAPPAAAAAPTVVRETASPAGPGSVEPWLCAAPGGRAYLSWLEPVAGKRHALRFAAWEGGAWSAPGTIVEDTSLFVNWADYPSILALPDGSLAAHWLRKTGAGTYDYEVRLARSSDGGKTWSAPVVPHRDGPRGEHGFVSLLPWENGTLAAVWVDGRKMVMAGAAEDDDEGPGDGEMMVRVAILRADGTLGPEALLDARTCECCQTGAAATSEGAVVAYRDRSEQEVRDIYLVRYADGHWNDPQPLARDGWRIAGCPVNGPAVAADGARVAVAWFTGANDSARVKVALSQDGGRSFGAPVQVDEGNPVGRTDVALLPEGSALVSWIEETSDTAFVRVRRVEPGGRLGAPLTVGGISPTRRSGFPRMERVGDLVLFAWTDPPKPARVRVAAARVSDLVR